MPESPQDKLVADIGGTNARFARASADARHGEPVTLRVADHPDVGSALRAALALLPGPPIRHVALAVAGPVTGDAVALTNAGRAFSIATLRAELGLAQLLVLNDFTALAWALPLLRADELVPVPATRRGDDQARPAPTTNEAPAAGRATHAGLAGPAHPAGSGSPVITGRGNGAPDLVPCAPLGVLGPGTGLGVSGLLPAGDGGWVAIAGEGGHASLAAADEREAAILAWVRRHHAHVSLERLVSGSGLPLLHAAVGAVDGHPASMPPARPAHEASGADAGGAMKAHETGVRTAPGASAHGAAPACPTGRGETGGGALDAADITRRALAGEPHARATLECFCAMLGGAAGNLALTLGARGGIYIGGGIASRITQFMQQSPFRARFEAKGRFAGYLEAIPTWIIDAPEAALRGAAHALARTPPATATTPREAARNP